MKESYDVNNGVNAKTVEETDDQKSTCCIEAIVSPCCERDFKVI